MKINWRKGNKVEFQTWESEKHDAREAILFCPGLPGMGGAVFEQRHAAALAEEGYAVHVIKHRGTKFSSAMAPQMINNAARLLAGRRSGETHLGGTATIDEWMLEPLRALEEIEGAYDSIHVIGNSFGALAALWSLTEENASVEKVKSLLLYAGAQGVDDGEDGIMRIWKPEFLMDGRVTSKITLNNPFDVVNTIADVYEALPGRVVSLPENVRLTYLVVDRDELFNIEDTKKFQSAIGGRGNIVMDTVDHAWPEHNLMAHDTPNYITEDLLHLIRG